MRISRRVRRPWAWRAYWARSLRARSATEDESEGYLQHIGYGQRTLELQIVHQGLFLGFGDVCNSIRGHCRVGCRDKTRHVGS
jgi:hypothetical protein